MQHMQPMQHQPIIKSGPQTVHAISLYALRVLYFHDNTFFYIHHKRNFAQGYILYCTPLEFQIVRRLMEHVDHVQSFAALYEHVTKTCDTLDIHALRKHIFRIRRKLPPYFRLVGVPRRGYILRYEGPKPARRQTQARPSRVSTSPDRVEKKPKVPFEDENLSSSCPVEYAE